MCDCIFCGFVKGIETSHINGSDFKILNETKYSISFLSIDFIPNADAHIIVIPKKHYEFFEQMPNYVINDLMKNVKKIGKILNIENDGYNILLNNGSSAGQFIPHAHFHIIPRKKGDGIEIETWNKLKVTKREYNKTFDKMKGFLDSK